MAAKKSKPADEIRRIYVIVGEDGFRVRRQVEALLDRLLDAEQRTMCLYQPKASEAQLREVLDELRTLPFLAPRRVVLLEDAGEFISEYREGLEKYFDAPSSCGVLILTVKSWPGNTRLAKKLPAVGELIEIGEIKRFQLPSFVTQCAREEFQKTISMEAAEMLVEWVGDEVGLLHSEVEKLAVFVGDRKAITPEDVESLIGHIRVMGAFDVIDRLASRNLSGALDALRQMFAADKSAEYTVIGAFAYHLRQLISVRALQDQGLSQEQIGRQLRLWDKRAANLCRQAGQMDLRMLGGLICDLARLDFAGKSGRMEIPTAMEQWVIQWAGRKG
jgi:DNA polymerase III subunit delta